MNSKTLFCCILADGSIHLCEAYTDARASAWLAKTAQQPVIHVSEFTKTPPPGATIWDVEGST